MHPRPMTAPWSVVLASFVLGHPTPAQDLPRTESPGQVEDHPSCRRVQLDGIVLAPDGSPAGGALVTSSAGGRAVTDVAGRYRLEVEAPPEATSVQVTAVSSTGGNLVANTSVALSSTARSARVDLLALGSSCSPSWQPTFGGRDGCDDDVFALATFDAGNGQALYAGGEFTMAGGGAASRIARWDGSSWAPLGSGVWFGAVHALAVHDDGGGSALYAGGSFGTAGGTAADRVAKWDGASWTPVGSGVWYGVVHALAVYDDGGGSALYAGGDLSAAGGVDAYNIAKWDGSSWTNLASWVNAKVRTLAVYDDGRGPALYAGGDFTTAGGAQANGIARWDGASWEALGLGISSIVRTLAVYDDGGGPALYAGGRFEISGVWMGIAKWDGSSWSELGSGTNANGTVDALAVHDDGSGPALFAGGHFATAGGVQANGIARWDGASWSALGSGVSPYPSYGVLALTVFDDGSGQALYAGGNFVTAGSGLTGRIAKWDGASWSNLGSGLNNQVRALAVNDHGGGPTLYAGGDGGYSTIVGGVEVTLDYPIAKWDGASWSALGSGTNNSVHALAAHDDGSGMALYVGGDFTTAGGAVANKLAKWDGASWSALGSGMDKQVLALAVHDDGGGPALFAGGAFTTAGGAVANRIAKWDGTSWSALGSGTSGKVQALAVYDDGAGPALYAGGIFTTAGGVAVNRIAKWDGTSWSSLGSGVSGAVQALAVYDDGGGPALYAGGFFTTAGGVAVNRIAKWDGASWSPLGGGMIGSVDALAVFDDGRGPALCAGGSFDSVDSGDSFVARWWRDTAPPALTCPPSVFVLERFGSSPGEVVHFSATASDESDPSPTVVCTPPSGSVFPRGTTVVTCTAADSCGNESTREFSVTVAPKVRRR